MQSLTNMHECRHGPKANCHKCLVPELVEALRKAGMHCDELRDAWERGALDSHDSSGGTRSNRNVDVLISIRAVLEKAKLIDPDCEARP